MILLIPVALLAAYLVALFAVCNVLVVDSLAVATPPVVFFSVHIDSQTKLKFHCLIDDGRTKTNLFVM